MWAKSGNEEMDQWSDLRAGEEAVGRENAGGNNMQRGVCNDSGRVTVWLWKAQTSYHRSLG